MRSSTGRANRKRERLSRSRTARHRVGLIAVRAERTVRVESVPSLGEIDARHPKQTRVLRERFGDIAANEIVDVLNNVEASSLTELRTLNELNFARFESKVELRFAEYDARMADRFLAHTRWMIGAWTTVFLAIMGLWFRK